VHPQIVAAVRARFIADAARSGRKAARK